MEKREPSYTVGENANYYSHYGEQCAAAAAKLHQSCPTLCDPIDSSPPGSLSMGFSRQEYWNGLPSPSPGDLPDPGIKRRSPVLQADSLQSEPHTVLDICIDNPLLKVIFNTLTSTL